MDESTHYKIICLVCKRLLGTKTKNAIKSFECRECQATHYYGLDDINFPSKSVPFSHKPKTKEYCGCNSCST